MSEHPAGAGETLLGRYRLLERLGAGASASVWRAHDRLRRRDVALKLLHPHLATDDTARQRLRLEARAARRLRHPGVARLLAAHLRGDAPALAFEWIPGRTLAERLQAAPPLAPAEAARIAAAVAGALAHAHGRGVVHRDVKPSNILLGADGGVRLLDFGVANDTGVSLLTDAGAAIGTLPYMAPEQLAGEPPLPASDVYALGAVLYEMLAGRRPYDVQSPLALARAQLEPPAPVAGAAAATGHVALAALRPAATDRPAAATMAAELERLAQVSDGATGQLDAAAPTTVVAASRAAASPAAGRVALGAAGAALALIVTTGIAGVLWLPQPTDEPASAPAGGVAGPSAPAAATPTPATVATAQPTAAPTKAPIEPAAAGNADQPSRADAPRSDERDKPKAKKDDKAKKDKGKKDGKGKKKGKPKKAR